MRSAGTWLGNWSATPGSAAHDEEALMPPQKLADRLVQELWQTLRAALETGKLPAGAASKLVGKLSWAASAMFRKVGRSMLR